MKVLIIRFSSIGDIVLTTPVIRCLRNQVSGVEIHYLTKPHYKVLLVTNPYVDKIHTLNGSLNETIGELRKEKFDLVIDLHHNLRTAIIKFRLRVRSFSFDKLNIQKWLLVRFKIDKLPAVHIVDRYLATVASLGVVDDGGGLDYFFSGNYALEHLLPASHLPGYTAIAIGGQHATKKLPVAKLIALCHQLSGPVVLLGGKEDAENGRAIAVAAGEEKIRNTCGELSLDQSAFLVKHADQVITHDTGLMHIAAAFDRPITSVWGNTVPGFGMYPYRVTLSKIVEHPGLPCRPCSKIGYDRCPLGHFKCMQELNMADVAAKIMRLN